MSHNETLKFLCFIDLLDRYFRDLFFTLDLSGGSKDHSSHVRGDRQTDISTRELKSKVAHATATKKKEKERRDADLWEDRKMENPYRGLQEHRVHMRSQTKEGECASRRNEGDYVPRRVKAGGTGVCLSFKGNQGGHCSKEESAKGETAKEVSDSRLMGLRYTM